MAQKNVNIANQSTGPQAYTSNPGSYTAAQINGAINSSSTTPPSNPLSITQGDTIEMICYEGQNQFSVEFRVDPNDTFIPGNTGQQSSGTNTTTTSGQSWATLPVNGVWTVTSSNTGSYAMQIIQRTYTDPKASLVTVTKYLWFTVTSSGSAPTSFTTQPSWTSANANSGATASVSTSPVANGSPAPTYSYSESSSLLSINSSTGQVTWSSANNSTSSRTATVTCTATNASGSLGTNRTVTQLGGPGVSGTYTYSQEVSSGGTESPSGSPSFTGTAGNWAVTSAGGSSTNGATINTSNGTITWTSNSGSSSRSVTVYRSVTRNGYSRWLSVGSASQEGSGGSGGTTSGTITEAQTYTHVRTEGSNYILTASSGATRTIFDVSTQASTGTASVTNTINSNSHTISYSPAATGTYTFTIRRRDQSAYYDSFAEFWLWQTNTTTLYNYSITVNPSAPSADTSVTVGQPFTSGATATGTVSGSGGSGGTVTYLLKTSSSTPTAGDAGWQSSNTFTGLSRGVTYYGWTKRTNVSGTVISVSGSRTMSYNAPSTVGEANNPNDNSSTIEINSAQSFLVKFRSLTSSSQYRLIGPSGTARDWFTPSGNETNSTGVNTSVSWAGAGTYTLQSRRPVANGGNNTTTATADTLSVITPVSGSITSTSLVGDDDTINVSGSVQNLSGSTNITYTVTRSDTGGTIASGTVTTAEDNESFNVNIAGVHTASSITFTLSWSGGIYSGSATDSTTILLRPTNLTFANDGDLSSVEDVTVTGSGGSNGTIQVSNNNSTWVTNGSKIDQSRNTTVTYYARRTSGGVSSGSYSETHYVGYLSPDSSISNVTNQVLAFGSTSTTVSIAGGNSVDQYRVNNSNSSSATDYGTRTGDGSITISGSELPGNGYSRTYYVWARRPAASGGNNSFVLTNESFTIGVNATPPTDYTTNPVWSNANANSGATSSLTTSPVANWSPGGTITYSTSSSNVSSINSSTGQITWNANEGTANRTATITVTANNSSLVGGGSYSENFTATQLGGASVGLSYSDVNANVTTQNDTTTGTHSSISYSKISGSSAGSVNSSTGVVTWTGTNEGTAARSITVRATASRNGDTDTVDATATQRGGSSITSFSYGNATNATAQTVNASISGTYDTVSYAVVSGSGATVNSSTGQISWTHNEGTSSRSVTIRATVSRNGDVDTADATSTQPGGASVSLSYSNVNANVTTQNDTTGGTYDSISYSKISGDATGSVNSTTGVVTWTGTNEGTSNRSITVRATATRNGDTDTVDATATQLGGASITAFSYPDATNATAQSLNETITGTYSTVSYAIVSGSGATVNASDGTLSWTHNEGSAARTVTVRATVTRNGDTDTADATSTQPGGATVSLSYSDVNANVTTQDDTTGGTYSSISYSKVSGDAAGSVNSTTGVVTWSSANEGTSNRSITVRATASRNGDTDTVDATATQLGGASITAFSYPDASNATAQNLNETISGTYSTVSYAIVSGSGATVNSSNGTLSWTHNESSSSRSVTVRATVTRNGDVDTADATSTQPGGATVSLSYANVNSNVTTQNDTTGGTYSSISYSKVSGDAAGSVNSTTGVVTWSSANEGSSNRSITVRATASRNGDTDTVDATATQLGGAVITSFSYPDATDATAQDLNETISGTYSTVSYAIVSGSGATVNSSNGTLSWTHNESTSSRSVTVRATVTRNGDTDTADATSTQPSGASVSLSYANVNSNVTTQNDTTGGTYDSISYSKLSGSANGSVNSTTGVVTWDSVNEGTSSRSITVRATASRNGDTDTVDAAATQLGGSEITAFSYGSTDAAAGSVIPSYSGTGTVSFAYQSGSTAYTSINATTGEVTWPINEGSASRSVTVRATTTRNGDIDTADATCAQDGGATVSLSYTNANANTTTQNPTVSGTYDSISYAKQSGSSNGTVNTATGVVTWDSTNEATSNRSIVVRATVSRNGDTDTVDATAAQLGGASITSFSYANKNATSGTVSPSVTATGTVTYSKVSGSTAASVNASTGVVTWSANEAASNRSATIRATVSRNGDVDTLDATTTQLAGAVASVSYPTTQPDQTTATPTLGGTGSYSNFELNPNPSYASINASTGVITWDLHQGTSDRSVTVQGQVENNGDIDTFSVTATQSGSANPTVSITGVADTTPNENTSDQVVASTTVGTNVNITDYSWTSTGPVSLSSTTVSNPTVTFGNVTQNTAASITVTVTDSTGRTAQATQNYTIQLVNNAPTATLVVPGTGSVTYEVPCSAQGAYDDDGHTLTFAFSVDDSGGTERFSQAASSSTEFSFTPTFADTYTVYMTVADGFGGSNQYSSQCVVTVGGPPPTGSNGGWGLELVNANNQVVLRSDELLVRKRTTTSSTSTSVSVPEANTEVFVASTGSSSSSSSSETWSVTGTTTKTVTKSGTGDTTLFIFK